MTPAQSDQKFLTRRASKLAAAVLTLTVFSVALSAVPAAIAASKTPGLTLSSVSYRVLFGHTTTISGRLRGTTLAGQKVVLDARRYGTSAPRRAATVRTSADGTWSVRVKPTIRTTYQAHVRNVSSRKIDVGVAPAVSVTELPNGRLRVHVRGRHAFRGMFVQLQQRVSHGTWKTVDRKPLSSASIAVIEPSIPTSTVRVAMSINQAGAGYLGAASHPLGYRKVALWVIPEAYKVLFGHALMLNGRLLNAGISQHITIYSRPYGAAAFKPLETVSTKKDGRFSLLVQPTIRTIYVARLGDVRKSIPVVLGVSPNMTVRRLHGRNLSVHVAAATSLRGRMVELQVRAGAQAWRTVAKAPLGSTSTATFHLALTRSTVRVAMSVNQAGAGYLGAFSHPLLVPAV